MSPAGYGGGLFATSRETTMLLRLALALLVARSGGSDGTSSSDEPDCSACSDDELCWYEFASAGGNNLEAITHCDPWPSWCDADRTCDCINTQVSAEGESACDIHGGIMNSNACEEIDGRPVLYCETMLG